MGKVQEKSFNLLKDTLMNKPILAMFNPEGYTDVYVSGVAGVLLHKLMVNYTRLVNIVIRHKKRKPNTIYTNQRRWQ